LKIWHPAPHFNHIKQEHDNWTTDDRDPHSLSPKEWKELLAIPEIWESWGLDEESTIETLATQIYAAKFHFHSGSPGYVGDLFIIQGDVLTGDPPFLLVREKGRLVLL